MLSLADYLRHRKTKLKNITQLHAALAAARPRNGRYGRDKWKKAENQHLNKTESLCCGSSAAENGNEQANKRKSHFQLNKRKQAPTASPRATQRNRGSHSNDWGILLKVVRMSAILLPTAAGEVVEILPSELPDDTNDIISILKDEAAPVKIWTQIAVSDVLRWPLFRRPGPLVSLFARALGRQCVHRPSTFDKSSTLKPKKFWLRRPVSVRARCAWLETKHCLCRERRRTFLTMLWSTPPSSRTCFYGFITYFCAYAAPCLSPTTASIRSPCC